MFLVEPLPRASTQLEATDKEEDSMDTTEGIDSRTAELADLGVRNEQTSIPVNSEPPEAGKEVELSNGLSLSAGHQQDLREGDLPQLTTSDAVQLLGEEQNHKEKDVQNANPPLPVMTVDEDDELRDPSPKQTSSQVQSKVVDEETSSREVADALLVMSASRTEDVKMDEGTLTEDILKDDSHPNNSSSAESLK